MRITSVLLGGVNFAMVMLAIPIIIVGIWLATNRDSECMHFLQQPTISIGAIILVVSVVGFLGSCYRVAWLLWIYLFLMMLVILVLVFFIVFTVVVAHRGGACTGFFEYRLGDYSKWLQRRVSSANNWRKIKGCLKDSNVCRGMSRFHDSESFLNASLLPLESGCCKPPISCGYSYENATVWNVTDVTDDSAQDRDCSAWSNNQDELCFNCDSCRAGLLANIRLAWYKVAFINLVVLMFVTIVYTLGCCAVCNARREGFLDGRWIF